MHKDDKTKKTIIIFSTVLLIIAVAIVVISVSHNFSHKLISIEKVKSELIGYKFSQHENLVFDCDVKYCNFDSTLYVRKTELDLSADDEEKNKMLKLVETFTGKPADESKLGSEAQDNVSYNADNVCGYVYESGTFLISDYNGYEDNIENEGQLELVKTYNPTDELDDEYTVCGEQYKLSDALKFCDDYVNEKIVQFLPEGITVELSKIAVINNGLFGGNCYVFIYNNILDGIPIDNTGYPTDESEYMTPSFLKITIDAKDHVFEVYDLIHKSAKVEEIKKIIPLSEAENLLSDYLAPLRTYNVTECELKYCCKREDMFTKEETWRPMWSFTLFEYNKSKLSVVLPKITAYVDAISGEVFVFDSDLCIMY